MNSLNYILARKLRKAKNKKQNGFTLIELMVVVAIVGVLSAVGLPELTKAQNRAKDATAQATVTNAAKECSLALIANDVTNLYDANRFKVDGTPLAQTCAEGVTLSGTSATGATVSNVFSGSTPGVTTITPAGG